MSKPLNFQQIIMTLHQYWADQGALVWQPYHETVGAGTANPGTILRVLGPEPWNIGYVEPSFRPDDNQYGMNAVRTALLKGEGFFRLLVCNDHETILFILILLQ